MSVLPKFPKIFSSDDSQQPDESVDNRLIRYEAEIGGQLFGAVPKGRIRQFFCLDTHTWVWYEEWSENDTRKSFTTRYEVRPNGVLKVQDGQVYQRLSKEEARHFYQATQMYRQRVGSQYQRMLQTA